MGKVHRKNKLTNNNKAEGVRYEYIELNITPLQGLWWCGGVQIHRALPNVFILHPFRALNYSTKTLNNNFKTSSSK